MLFLSSKSLVCYGCTEYVNITKHCAPHVRSIFHRIKLFKSVSTLYRLLPNMSQNSAAHQKKVEHAVWKLLNRWTGGVGVTRGDATTSWMRDGN